MKMLSVYSVSLQLGAPFHRLVILTWGASAGSPEPRPWPKVSGQQGAPQAASSLNERLSGLIWLICDEDEDEEVGVTSAAFLFTFFHLVACKHQRAQAS